MADRCPPPKEESIIIIITTTWKNICPSKTQDPAGK
jgi:hypothetical protein